MKPTTNASDSSTPMIHRGATHRKDGEPSVEDEPLEEKPVATSCTSVAAADLVVGTAVLWGPAVNRLARASGNAVALASSRLRTFNETHQVSAKASHGWTQGKGWVASKLERVQVGRTTVEDNLTV